MHNTAEPVALEKKDIEVLKKDSENLKVFNTYSSSENQNVYLDQINKSLESGDISEHARNLLLLRKASVLATLKGTQNQEKYIQEATNIFKELIATQEKDKNSIYVKDVAIIAAVKLHTQCCFSASLFDRTSDEYNEYRKIGYTTAMIDLIKLDELSREVSLLRKNDVSNITNKFSIYLLLLDRHKEKLTYGLYDKIYSELGETLDDYKSAQVLIFKDPANAVLRPATHYAAAYDRYYSLSPAALTKEKNVDIDSNYTEGLTKIKQTTSLAGNTPLVNEMLAYHLIAYISSNERRYGAELSSKLNQELLKEVEASLTSSKEVEAIFKGYFLAGIREPEFKNSTLYYFFKAAMKNKELKESLMSMGITEVVLGR